MQKLIGYALSQFLKEIPSLPQSVIALISNSFNDFLLFYSSRVKQLKIIILTKS